MITQIFHGDNRKVVSSWKSNTVDAIVTDPPYELGFMGKSWDSSGIAYSVHMWKAMLRVTKPGGFLLCFGGTRTVHRLACAIEDAGWEIRDCMMWLYGSGFPKSHNISKAIDKAAGATRKVVGQMGKCGMKTAAENYQDNKKWSGKILGKAITPLARLWSGYGTALKPAWEPIIVAMKPLDGTFAANAEKYGVAGLNIDGGRIGTETITVNRHEGYNSNSLVESTKGKWKGKQEQVQGRWPANLILDEEAGAMLDEQTGTLQSGDAPKKRKAAIFKNCYGKFQGNPVCPDARAANSGGASRFFYCAKTSRKERNMGMEGCEDKLLARSGGARSAEKQGKEEYLQEHIGLNRVAVVKNNHPTVKPLALMKYLCALLKMPSTDQVILDPFMGSGTTGMACASLGISFFGIEKELDYCVISSKRIGSILGETLPVTKNVETPRMTTDSAGGGRRPNESLPHVSENRQSIINAASTALREKRK